MQLVSKPDVDPLAPARDFLCMRKSMQPGLLVSPLVSRTEAGPAAGCRGLSQVSQAASALAAQIHRTAERRPEGFRRPLPY